MTSSAPASATSSAGGVTGSAGSVASAASSGISGAVNSVGSVASAASSGIGGVLSSAASVLPNSAGSLEFGFKWGVVGAAAVGMAVGAAVVL